jgi:hypothetical protein
MASPLEQPQFVAMEHIVSVCIAAVRAPTTAE